MFKTQLVPFRTSSFIRYITVNILAGECQVMMKSGDLYLYTHVSRRAMIKLLLNRQESLGFFFNTHCTPYNCKSAQYGQCVQLLSAAA